ncbi:MAG TPA: hypothetical protein VF487_20410 [Chitinophagaceae bacterium]
MAPKNKPEVKLETPAIEIKAAKLKDDFCNYSYELTEGVTAGDVCNRSGASIVHDDMKLSFKNLNVHLAVICEEISPNEIDIDNLPDINNETLKGKEKQLAKRIDSFAVSAFKIDGTGENEGVVLIGTKKLSSGDYLKLEAPKVKWSENYDFIQELMADVSECKNEVEEYMNGKTAPKMVQQDLFDDNENSGQ